jgi:rubrerythrin
VARLFRAASYSEELHARNHLRALDGVQSTADNLEQAIDGETYEVEEMYPSFIGVADAQGESKAVRTMEWALETEKVHAALFSRAQQAVQAGNDIEQFDLWICPVCGFAMEGEPPDTCPICSAKRSTFRRF